MSKHIRYEVSGSVGTITIDRPEKRNAITYAMLNDLINTFREAGADGRSRVIIFTGVPGSFCAGTDLADLATIPGNERGLRGESGAHDVWWPAVACPKPVIAAIDGPAVGMGAEYSSHCDVRIGTPNARFAWNFAHRGLVPDTGAGSWLLPRLIGVQPALRLLYSGDMIGSDEALRLGFLSAVVPPEEDEAPLAVDPDRMLAATIAPQGFKPVSRWKPQIVQLLGRVECGEFPACRGGEIACHAPWHTAGEDERGRFVTEAPDHEDT